MECTAILIILFSLLHASGFRQNLSKMIGGSFRAERLQMARLSGKNLSYSNKIRYYSYLYQNNLCPIWCAMLKAVINPWSLMTETDEGKLHIPARFDTPEKS